MNRSNIGNITTNAMQTLNISGTAFAGMIRRDKADASSALNAQKKEAEKLADKEYKRNRQEKIDARREELDTAKLKGIEAKTNLDVAKANDLASKTEARNLRIAKIKEVGTPQAEEIAKKVTSDLGWYRDFYKEVASTAPRDSEGLASLIKELTSGGKSDGSKDV